MFSYGNTPEGFPVSSIIARTAQYLQHELLLTTLKLHPGLGHEVISALPQVESTVKIWYLEFAPVALTSLHGRPRFTLESPIMAMVVTIPGTYYLVRRSTERGNHGSTHIHHST